MSKSVVEVSLVWWIVDKLKMGIPSVVAGNAKSAIIALLPNERVEERTLVVVKKDGTREQFSRDKIFNGIIRSAQKRPVSSDEIEENCKPDRAKGSQPK